MSTRLMLMLGVLCAAIGLVGCTASAGSSESSTSASTANTDTKVLVAPPSQSADPTLSPETLKCDPPHCFGDCTVVQTTWPTNQCAYIMTHCTYGCTNGVCNKAYNPQSPPIGNGC